MISVSVADYFVQNVGGVWRDLGGQIMQLAIPSCIEVSTTGRRPLK